MQILALPIDQSTTVDTRPAITGRPPASISAGKTYEVQAVAFARGRPVVLLVDETDHPAWAIASNFAVVDSSIPADWVCEFAKDEPCIFLGPPFMAEQVRSQGAGW